jgi:hypothetical protein
MKEKLTKLYNTLAQIETKGENTKLMAACLNYTQQLIAEYSANQGANEKIVNEGSEAT